MGQVEDPLERLIRLAGKVEGYSRRNKSGKSVHVSSYWRVMPAKDLKAGDVVRDSYGDERTVKMVTGSHVTFSDGGTGTGSFQVKPRTGPPPKPSGVGVHAKVFAKPSEVKPGHRIRTAVTQPWNVTHVEKNPDGSTSIHGKDDAGQHKNHTAFDNDPPLQIVPAKPKSASPAEASKRPKLDLKGDILAQYKSGQGMYNSKGQDDFGREAATKMSDAQLDEAIKHKSGEKGGMSTSTDLGILTSEKKRRAEGKPLPAEKPGGAGVHAELGHPLQGYYAKPPASKPGSAAAAASKRPKLDPGGDILAQYKSGQGAYNSKGQDDFGREAISLMSDEELKAAVEHKKGEKGGMSTSTDLGMLKKEQSRREDAKSEEIDKADAAKYAVTSNLLTEDNGYAQNGSGEHFVEVNGVQYGYGGSSADLADDIHTMQKAGVKVDGDWKNDPEVTDALKEIQASEAPAPKSGHPLQGYYAKKTKLSAEEVDAEIIRLSNLGRSRP